MQKTKIHKVRLTEKQAESLAILKSYDVNLSQFIRAAIKKNYNVIGSQSKNQNKKLNNKL